jgi:hypothetical protein
MRFLRWVFNWLLDELGRAELTFAMLHGDKKKNP